MTVTGIFKIKCNNCKKEHDFLDDEHDFDLEYGEERAQGRENGYLWSHNYDCKCSNNIDIEYEVWEYPLGTFNTDNIIMENAIVIQRYDYDFN